jgi:hypothetical protein
LKALCSGEGIVFFVIFAVIMEALILDFEVFPQL